MDNKELSTLESIKLFIGITLFMVAVIGGMILSQGF